MENFRRNPMYRYLLLLTVAGAIGLQGWRNLFNNFAVDQVGIDGFQVGIIQSVREIPGFLALLVAFLLLIVRPARLAALAILVLGLGVAAAGRFPSFPGLIFTTFLMSLGFHYLETVNQTIVLCHFSHDDAPHVMGRLRSWLGVANIGVGAVIYGLTFLFSLSGCFLAVGGVVILAALLALIADPGHENPHPQTRRVRFRRRYLLYYLLSFLAGARRQIFVCFAVFLLVKHYGFGVREIAALFVINNLLTYFLNPLIARGIARWGERRMLTVEYSALTLIFLGYGLLPFPAVAAAFYVLDHVFFGFTIGLNTYLQKVADPAEITSAVAAGFTVNHVSAVVIPVIGGGLWLLDWRLPFWGGAVLAALSLFAVQRIRLPRRSA